jgi:topoisomerase-4 subunit A
VAVTQLAVTQLDVAQLFDHYFLQYSSYYIRERAIPQIADGLKPAQRRILHTLHQMDDGKFHKVANVVGQTMQLHPHGDQSIGAALVNLANKELLIERQGNFGNIHTGDAAAAPRYIECRLTPLALATLFNAEITEYVESYDGRSKEPVVLPVKLPLLLAQGAEGIAVGMATKILPHNLVELWNAQIRYLRGQPFEIYPDFATGGLIDVTTYDDGNGKILVRAEVERFPDRLVVRSVPFGVSTEQLIASIEQAAREQKVRIRKITDFTAQEVEIELGLPPDINPEYVVDTLYAFTDCEISISAHFLVLDGEQIPRRKSASEALRFATDRLVVLLEEELQLAARLTRERIRAKTIERVFVEEGLYKSLEGQGTTAQIEGAVRRGLEPYFGDVRDTEIERLLRIPIRRISLYDRKQFERELQSLEEDHASIEGQLADVTQVAVRFIGRLKRKFGKNHRRRTRIETFAVTEKREVAPRELRVRFDKRSGYIGHSLSEGDVLFDLSAYDPVLLIRQDGSYIVSEAPAKLHAGRDMLYCAVVDPDTIFSIVYTDPFGDTFIKRCTLGSYALNRTYSIIPEYSWIGALTTDATKTICLTYVPRPRMRKKQETFDIADYPVRSIRAGGIRLSSKELADCCLE